MSGNTLYNKYRPLLFKEVVGQEGTIRSLTSFFKKNSVPHAILFSGLHGIGKTTLARIIARRLNCENPKGEEPCNECRNCKAALLDNHMDVEEIDAASQRGIDNIRELQARTRTVPQLGKNKVFIIDEVHELTSQAVDSILKTLEEPPSNLYFIFATTDIYKIKKTFLSRCIKFKLWRVRPNYLTPHLITICKKEKIDYEEEALHQLCSMTSGSVRDAISLLETLANIGVTKENIYSCGDNLNPISIFNLFDKISRRDCKGFIVLVEDIMDKGTEPFSLISEFIRHLLNIYYAQLQIQELKTKVIKEHYDNYLEYARSFNFDIIKCLEVLKNNLPVYKEEEALISLLIFYKATCSYSNNNECDKVKTIQSNYENAQSSNNQQGVTYQQTDNLKKENTSSDNFRDYSYWFIGQIKGEVLEDTTNRITFKTITGTFDCVKEKGMEANSRFITLNTLVDLYKKRHLGFTLVSLVQSGEIEYNSAIK